MPVLGTTPGSRAELEPFDSLLELVSLTGADTTSLYSVVVLVRSVVTTCAFTAMRTPGIVASTSAMRARAASACLSDCSRFSPLDAPLPKLVR